MQPFVAADRPGGAVGFRLGFFDSVHQPAHRVGPICNARRLRRRKPLQRGMNPDEVVIHEVERDRVGVIEQLLAKTVGAAREPTYRHTHGQVLALDQRRGDVVRVGIAGDDHLALIDFGGAVDFGEHGVVHVLAKRLADRPDVGVVAVGGQLDAVSKTAFEVLNKPCSF